MDFEWDAQKASSNLRKHGVLFSLATRVFADGMRTERLESGEHDEEDRWKTVGLVAGVELVVIYTVRADTVRLISARRAERYEREEYWHGSIHA